MTGNNTITIHFRYVEEANFSEQEDKADTHGLDTIFLKEAIHEDFCAEEINLFGMTNPLAMIGDRFFWSSLIRPFINRLFWDSFVLFSLIIISFLDKKS
jgi:hypothetical protein